MRLAIDGGEPAIKGPLKTFKTIDESEVKAAVAAIRSGPLSGYLGGVRTGGLRCEILEHEFAHAVGAKYAVACNSATSGLLMACAALGVKHGSNVVTTPYTMSATAAAPAFLGARVTFADIDYKFFCLTKLPHLDRVKAMIPVNLFGHSARIHELAKICRDWHVALIEDNSHAPFAAEYGKFTGTISDIGVWSFNVHKHLNCGEGGICVTNDEGLASRLSHIRNHGELDPSGDGLLGLNLRLSEPLAAIALAQLNKREEIIDTRVQQGEFMTKLMQDWPLVWPPVVREGCKHVYYIHATIVGRDRDWLVRALNAEGVPVKAGYVTPLYKLPAFMDITNGHHCPMTEGVESKIMVFENCAYDPTMRQRKKMKEAFAKVGEAWAKRREQEMAYV